MEYLSGLPPPAFYLTKNYKMNLDKCNTLCYNIANEKR